MSFSGVAFILIAVLQWCSPAAHASPPDEKVDCAIKQLAWEYGKKLQPWYGDFKAVYDALQLSRCNVSLTSGRKNSPNASLKRPLSVDTSRKAYDIAVYVDGVSGDDSNAGTVDKPVKTLQRGIGLYRSKKSRLDESGIVYVKKGTYYLTETIKIGVDDNYLTICGLGAEKPVISGGRLFHLKGLWKEMVNNISVAKPGISAINESDTAAGTSNRFAKFYGKTDNVETCRSACVKDPTCFAFTWYDTTKGDFANMCYFRIDSLWLPMSNPGAYSGKKLNIFVANLTGQNPYSRIFSTLFINGRRAVRARYPDGNPETMGRHTNPTGYVSSAESWLPPFSGGENATDIFVDSPQRNRSHFPYFQIGVNGPASPFTPPESYWAGSKHIAGALYGTPLGLQYLPNETHADMWKRVEYGIVHAFQGHYWGNWQFRVRESDYSKKQIKWYFGGFQEARGAKIGKEWYVENYLAELTSPGEWYFDDSTNLLYLYPNGSVPDEAVGTTLQRLIDIIGSQKTPVLNVSLVNLTFTHTETTFLEPYEVPSGGDWAIHRGGAVFVEGAEMVTVSNCLFDSPGGNGLFLSNYMRYTVIEYNEFKLTGDSAIALIGSTNLIDGTDGNQPRSTAIRYNLMHEIGVFGKQTSAFVQSLACLTSFDSNVLFNGPRAGINFNDGFGGSNSVLYNLAFNWVRETHDHGVFNSWDRQPYLTRVGIAPGASLIPGCSYISYNFFISNYYSFVPVDHDDGSCYYLDTDNFFVYGGYKNHLGHTKRVLGNYYIYPDVSGKPYCGTHTGATVDKLPSGFDEEWANNTCVIGNPDIYSFVTCNPNGNNTGLIPFTANNSFYAPNKDVFIRCGDQKLSLAEFQAMGYDIGSQVFNPVDASTIVDWGRKLLGI